MNHRFFLLSLLFIWSSFELSAQSTNDYRSIADGNWTSTAVWQRYNGTAWVAATNYPGQIAGTNRVTIEGGDTVVLNSNIPNFINEVFVGNGDGTTDTLEIDGNSSIDTDLFYINNDGVLSWSANRTFTLPASVAFVVIPGGIIESGTNGCSAAQRLVIGNNRYATCNGGAGADFTFQQLTDNGGNLFIFGTVFEDVNYPGGNGRDNATANGVGLENVTVELYEGTSFEASTTTNANGEYFFGEIEDNETYNIRILNTSIRSSRGGGTGCTTCIPVQTFRREFDGNSTPSFTDITIEVGGNDPDDQESAGGSLTGAQSVSEVEIDELGANGVDFGFNFNTIVNTNDDGQGSLEQFIINSNNLNETGLDIEANSIFDPAAGDDVSIFMIPPTGDPLGRTADTNYGGGYFDIEIPTTNLLPNLTDNNTHIDGRTQTSYSGDTNVGTVGSGGTAVGVSGTVLPNYNRPEIQVRGDFGDILRIQDNNITIRNLAVYGGNRSSLRQDSGTNTLITENLLGVDATGVKGTVGVGSYSDDGFEINGGTATVDGNYIAENTDFGVSVNGGSAITIQNNHITTNGFRNCEYNVRVQNGNTTLIQTNLIENSGSAGIFDNEGDITITENTITSSGENTGCANKMGILLQRSNTTISSNIIFENGQSGIATNATASNGNSFSQNSIYANGTITNALGIDLGNNGITFNDTNDSDTGPNGLPNFPILESAIIAGTTLIIKGWSRPNTTIEVFLTDINQGSAAAGDNTLTSPTPLDYGEGQIYLGNGTEGSAGDTDATTSSYAIDGNADTTNRFSLNITLGATIPVGSSITTTGTIVNSTSEFSFGFVVKGPPTVITNRRITYRVKPSN